MPAAATGLLCCTWNACTGMNWSQPGHKQRVACCMPHYTSIRIHPAAPAHSHAPCLHHEPLPCLPCCWLCQKHHRFKMPAPCQDGCNMSNLGVQQVLHLCISNPSAWRVVVTLTPMQSTHQEWARAAARPRDWAHASPVWPTAAAGSHSAAALGTWELRQGKECPALQQVRSEPRSRRWAQDGRKHRCCAPCCCAGLAAGLLSSWSWDVHA